MRYSLCAPLALLAPIARKPVAPSRLACAAADVSPSRGAAGAARLASPTAHIELTIMARK